MSRPNNMENIVIAAYDIGQDRYIWNFTTPIGNKHTVIVNESNVYYALPG